MAVHTAQKATVINSNTVFSIVEQTATDDASANAVTKTFSRIEVECTEPTP